MFLTLSGDKRMNVRELQALVDEANNNSLTSYQLIILASEKQKQLDAQIATDNGFEAVAEAIKSQL